MKRLSMLIALGCLGGIAHAQLVEDFESCPSYPFAADKWMFRDANISGSTSPLLAAVPAPKTIVKAIPAALNRSGHAAQIGLTWLSADVSFWCRVSTNSTANKPRPIIDYTKKLMFDVYSVGKPIFVALGTREISTAGVVGADGGASGTLEWVSNGLMPGGPQPTGFTGVVAAGPYGGDLIPADTWVTVTLDLPNAGGSGGPKVRAFATGNGILSSPVNQGTFEHLMVQQQIADAGPYEIWIDNITHPVAALTGTLDLGSYDLSVTQPTFNYELRNGATVLQSGTTTPNSSGAFSISTSQTGTYDLWLRKAPFLGVLKTGVTTGAVGTISMKGGDIDNDNAVTILDYSVLSDYFDMDSSASDWSTVGGNGYAPKDADIDNDNAVTILDYSILSDNFDQTGID